MPVALVLPVVSTVVLAALWWRSGLRLNSADFYRLVTVVACLAFVIGFTLLT